MFYVSFGNCILIISHTTLAQPQFLLEITSCTIFASRYGNSMIQYARTWDIVTFATRALRTIDVVLCPPYINVELCDFHFLLSRLQSFDEFRRLPEWRVLSSPEPQNVPFRKNWYFAGINGLNLQIPSWKPLLFSSGSSKISPRGKCFHLTMLQSYFWLAEIR